MINGLCGSSSCSDFSLPDTTKETGNNLCREKIFANKTLNPYQGPISHFFLSARNFALKLVFFDIENVASCNFIGRIHSTRKVGK